MKEATFDKKEKRNLLLYLFSRAFLSFGDGVYSFAIAFFILYETGSALASSINLVVYTLVSLVCLPFAGYVADKFNKKFVIIIGELIDPIVILGLLIYTMNYGFNLTAVYIVTGIVTFTSAFVGNAFQSAMTEIFNALHMQKVLGYQQSIVSLSNILAPVVAGAIIGMFSLEFILATFVILGFFAVIVDFIIDFKLYYDETLYGNEGEEITFFGDITEGISFIFKSEIFRPIVVFLVFINFFAAILSIFPSKVLIVELGLQSEKVGFVYAMSGVGTIVASVFIAKIKQWRNPVFVTKVCTLILAIFVALFAVPLYLPVSTNMKMVLIMLLFIGNSITLTFLNTPMMRFFQMAIPQKIKGRVFSMLSVAALSVMPIGAIMYGYVLDLDMYFVATAATAIAILILVLLVLNKKLINRSKKVMDTILVEEKDETDSLVVE